MESALLSFRADNETDSSPYEVGLGQLVNGDRSDNFIGKAALARIAREGPERRQTGLFIDGAKLPGNQHPWLVSDGAGAVGTVRVVTYSPRLERNIAIALLDVGVEDQEHFRVQTLDGWRDATRTTLPFI